MNKITYKDIRPKLNTGDIVLFSGKTFISKIIKWGTRSKWSHVGVVIRIRGWGFVLLWESTTLTNVSDIDLGTTFKGVQIVSLSDRINKYRGMVGIRHLEDVDFTDDDIKSLQKLRKNVLRRPYEKDWRELIGATLGKVLPVKAGSLNTVFCSELVAEVYRNVGLLPEDTVPNSFCPDSFADKNLILEKGRLSDVYIVAQNVL